MFYEPNYRALFPFMSQLTKPEGFWVQASVFGTRRFAAYREQVAA
jgi:hypothetical protein